VEPFVRKVVERDSGVRARARCGPSGRSHGMISLAVRRVGLPLQPFSLDWAEGSRPCRHPAGWRQYDAIHGIRRLDHHVSGMASQRHLAQLETSSRRITRKLSGASASERPLPRQTG
jgi:hypothetical protein